MTMAKKLKMSCAKCPARGRYYESAVSKYLSVCKHKDTSFIFEDGRVLDSLEDRAPSWCPKK